MSVLAAADKAAEDLEQEDLELRKERGDFVDEDEDEPVATKADDDKEDPEDKAGSRDVPHARFNRVNEAYKEEREARLRLEGEAIALRKLVDTGGAKTADVADEPVSDPDTLRVKAGAAMMEGEHEEAAKLYNQAAKIDRQLAKQEAVAEFRKEQADREMERVADKLYGPYPFLKSGGPDENQEAIDAVIVHRNYLVHSLKIPPAEALERAAKLIGDGYLASAGGGNQKGNDAAPVKNSRDAEAIKKAADAALRQPAVANGGKGERSRTSSGDTVIDWAKLTEAQFNAMPESEKARGRGDIVE